MSKLTKEEKKAKLDKDWEKTKDQLKSNYKTIS